MAQEWRLFTLQKLTFFALMKYVWMKNEKFRNKNNWLLSFWKYRNVNGGLVP